MALERIIISCGGTGGHFYPGLSAAREFQAQGGSVLLLLSGVNSVRQAEIAEEFGIEAVVLPNMPHPLRRPFAFLKGFCGGFFKSLKVMKTFAPQALLGMGSFAMLPILIAAIWRKVTFRGMPLILHDGNARIGKANRWFSLFADFMGTAFPAVNADKCRCRCECTGMPVRPELAKFAGMEKKEAVEALNKRFNLNFDAAKPVVLIVGGSQGAEIFNLTIPEALIKNPGAFQVLHLAGKGKAESAKGAYRDVEIPLLLLESDEHMEYFYGAADFVFCRSGGSTVAELALFGKAAVLTPYPFAAEKHQDDNARYLADAGAGVMISNSEFSAELVGKILSEFLEKPEKWLESGKKAAALAYPDASQRLLKQISGLCH